VDVVVVTHGHDDHYVGLLRGGDPRFPYAEVFFPSADWDDIQRGEMFNSEVGARILAPIEASGKLRLVSGDLELDDGITLLHTPGETRGHQVVRFAHDGKSFYYLGDLVHFPIEVQKLRWAVSPRSDSDYEDFARSRVRVLADATANQAALVFTHGIFPAWGVADAQTEQSWSWRYT
jgi:glyoxylase-like metal-dependent hydrolase (beta-lactamase superfamily II)